MSNNERYCFAWPGSESPTGASKGALWRQFAWPPRSKITVSFLDGDEGLRKRVTEVAREWVGDGLAKLKLDFRTDTTKTDVRIAFVPGNGSWSLVGTSCKQIAHPKPTMNFGWLTPESSDDDLRRVVLHEFGHALGLLHEHMSPAVDIRWKKDVVYAELGDPPNSWSKETVDINLFTPFLAADADFTAFDPKSIMLYPIPAHWTEDGFSTGLNAELSETDKLFIAKTYQ